MIFVLLSQISCLLAYHLGTCLAQCPNSVLNLKALVGTWHFQPGEGPSRGNLRDYENFGKGSLRALVKSPQNSAADCLLDLDAELELRF